MSRSAMLALVLGLMLAAGGWLRLHHLGDLGLVADEGNQVQAVQGILDSGVPRVPSGRLYTRGLPFLYLEAALASVFGLNEFTLRLPAALFGIAGILAAYLLACSLFDRRVGLVTAALMVVSVWEVEMSRYGRFYTAWQCLFLLCLAGCYRGFLLGRRWHQVMCVAAILLALTLHELSGVIAACFLIPLLSDSTSCRSAFGWVAGAAATVAAWMGYRQVTESLGAPEMATAATGAGVVGTAEGMFSLLKESLGKHLILPHFEAIERLVQERPLGFFIVTAWVAVWVAVVLVRGCRRGRRRWLAVLPMLAATWAHQFAVFFIFMVLYGVRYTRSVTQLLQPPWPLLYTAAAGCLLFWALVLPGEGLPLTHLGGYPDFYQSFPQWFMTGWPVVLPLSLAGLALLARRLLADRRPTGPLFLLGAIFLPALMASVVRTKFHEMRYIFHLYPLLLIACAVALVEVERALAGRLRLASGWWAAARTAACLLLVLPSADWNPVHAWSVGSRTYRSERDPLRGHLNWKPYAHFHQDQQGPGRYVAQHRGRGDLVIGLGVAHMIAVYQYYAGPVDYVVDQKAQHAFRRTSDGKRVNHVTGSVLIESVDDLGQLLRQSQNQTVWLLGDTQMLLDSNYFYSNAMKERLRALATEAEFFGRDGKTFVKRIGKRR